MDKPRSICLAPWPDLRPEWYDPKAEEEMGIIMGIITEVRRIRSAHKIPPGAKIKLYIVCREKQNETI